MPVSKKKTSPKKKSTQSAKKAPRKAPAKTKGKGLPVVASPELVAVAGHPLATRKEALGCVWRYIKQQKLQRGQVIHPDALLAKVTGSAPISFGVLTRKVSEHLTCA